MRLRYENTFDDLLAFQEHFYAHSPTIKRALSRNRWVGAAFVAALIFLILHLIHGWQQLVAETLAAAIGFILQAFTYPITARRSLRQNAHKLYAEGSNKGFTGAHELEIHADGIVERTAYNETKMAWGALEKIETTPTHTFLYTGPRMAHVIPHHAITEGDYAAFMTQIKQNYQPDATLNRQAL